MKATIGVLMFLAGLALAAYLGLWVMFVGGIVQIVEAVKAAPVDSWGIAYGIVRIVFASVGAFPGIFLSALGLAVVKGS